MAHAYRPPRHPCIGKVRHLTREEALRVVLKMRQRDPKDALWLNAYHCECCQLWHVGHAPWWVRLAVLQSRAEQIQSASPNRKRRPRTRILRPKYRP